MATKSQQHNTELHNRKKTAPADYRNRAQHTFIYKHDGGDTRLKRRDEQGHM
jgi:hypothetical protein